MANAIAAEVTPAARCIRSSRSCSWASSPVSRRPFAWLTVTRPMARPSDETGAVAEAPLSTGALGGSFRIVRPLVSTSSTAKSSSSARWCSSAAPTAVQPWF